MFGVVVSTLCWYDPDPSQEIHSHIFVFKELANPCIFQENSLICYIFSGFLWEEEFFLGSFGNRS